MAVRERPRLSRYNPSKALQIFYALLGIEGTAPGNVLVVPRTITHSEPIYICTSGEIQASAIVHARTLFLSR